MVNFTDIGTPCNGIERGTIFKWQEPVKGDQDTGAQSHETTNIFPEIEFS